jgi:hypothetical protein
MEEIDCLACGEILVLPKYINVDKYDGQLTCQGCNSLLYIKLVKGSVQKYKIVENNRERDIKIIYKPADSKKEENDIE